MNETHTKDGDKALLMLNWSIGPEFKDGNKTGNMSLILTEVYENQAGIDDHFEQAQNNGATFRDDFNDFESKCENLVKINSSDIIQSMW